MVRMLILYTLFWVRLGYRLWRGVAHWCLRPVPMPSMLRHYIAGAIADLLGFGWAFAFTGIMLLLAITPWLLVSRAARA